MRKQIGNYAWDFDARAWARVTTLSQYTWLAWSQCLRHVNFQDKVFTPDGCIGIQPTETETHNQRLEQEQIAEIKTSPERLFLYVKVLEHGRADVTTWPGTVVGNAELGPVRTFACWGSFPSKRQSVNVCIFGTWYHGWYFKSSGDYCRLKRDKRR